MRLFGGATLGALFLVVVVAGAVYVPGLPGEFVYDDHRLIEKNEGLRRPFDPRRALLHDYYASDNDRLELGYYRPTAILSNELDFRRGGGAPLAFHVTNILIHCACAALVLLLALQLFGGRLPAAFAAGMLFALHPAHAESVAFISGRVDPLATLGVLLAALAHLAANRSPRPGGLRVAAGAAWLLALLSKEMAVTAPLLLFGLEAAEEGLPGRDRLLQRFARYLPYALAALCYLTLRRLALGTLLAPATGAPVSLAAPLVTLGSYLAWLALPPPTLHVEPSPAAGFLGLLAGTLAIGASLSVLALWLTRHRRAAALCAWCVVALLPVAQLRPIETELSERFLYLPSVGACLLFALLLACARGRKTRIAAAAFLVVLGCFYAWLLHERVPAWRDEVRLWREKLDEDPTSVRGLLSLARALASRGDLEGARAIYERAKAQSPWLADGIRGELESYAAARGAGGSVEAIQESLASSPNDAALWSNLGFLLLERGDFEGARAGFERSVALVPPRSTAWLGLGLARLALDDDQGAAQAALRAESLNPALALARVIRAQCELRAGRACAALRLLPQDPLEDPGEEAMRRSVAEKARLACAEKP